MRLRQVAFIAHRIAPVADQLGRVFGLKVGFHDPGVEVFGLKNVVMPVGGEFLEVLEPFRDDASGARYLARRGGDAGYMVILQDADALAHRARLEAAGVRVIARSPDRRYQFTHFHPGDCAGVLMSIDSVVGDAGWRDAKSDWPPAGPGWRDFESEESLGIVSVTIQSRDPVAAAERWSTLLAAPAKRAGAAMEIALDPGLIRFVEPVDADGTGVVGLDVVMRDPAAAFEAARALGLETSTDSVRICGVAIRPVKGS
ncbi:MAG TPA: VOC family protein [Caulobacteraceae bacterium]|nr:VOC family protein [Caulobacteraceae bacterium]